MTEDRVGNIAKALGTVIAVIVLVLAIIAHAFGQVADIQPSGGQNSATHDHSTNRLSRWRLVRIVPAKITYIERNEKGTRIEYATNDQFEIENGYFQTTKETTGDAPKKGEWFWFTYCLDDRYLYGIYKPTVEQLKVLK